MTAAASDQTSAVTVDPVASAKAAGLRYISGDRPGIRREQQGREFVFFKPDGSRVTDEAEITRIKKLAIPPAYQDVWISPIPNGHLQATGRDARGRKQYRYHQKWREVRDESKFGRMLAFAKALPKIRAAIDQDLALRGLPRRKILAAVVALLESTLIRVGNEEYARENKSYGLTTMRTRHVKVQGSLVRFRFRGKSGKDHDIDLVDRRLAAIIKRCRDIPGQDLFQYLDDDGTPQSIDSDAVNDYIQEISGEAFTAKDFRTWMGTVVCAVTLAKTEECTTIAERKRTLNEAIKDVSQRLGNTPAVCRKSYIHPEVMAAYMDAGAFALAPGKALSGLREDEDSVLNFFEQRESQGDATQHLLELSLKKAKRAHIAR